MRGYWDEDTSRDQRAPQPGVCPGRQRRHVGLLGHPERVVRLPVHHPWFADGRRRLRYSACILMFCNVNNSRFR
jgi:hypothetical protein